MAQTRRKRRSKHRGTPAGTIEARGRTGRPPSPQERRKQERMSAREKRLNTPPTWKSSATRALLAAGIVFLFILISSKKNGLITAVGFSLVALIFYIPAGYYLELTLYRRRQRKQLMNKGGGR
jgi:Flp pilus assembly protein TadB